MTKKNMLLLVLAGLLGAAIPTVGCGEARPSREECQRACEHAGKLQLESKLRGLEHRLRRVEADKRPKLREEQQQLWRDNVAKQNEDCAIQCSVSGTKQHLECTLAAKNLSDLRVCRRRADKTKE